MFCATVLLKETTNLEFYGLIVCTALFAKILGQKHICSIMIFSTWAIRFFFKDYISFWGFTNVFEICHWSKYSGWNLEAIKNEKFGLSPFCAILFLYPKITLIEIVNISKRFASLAIKARLPKLCKI